MEGFEAQHKRFWRQVILWLARKDEAAEGNVWIKLAAAPLRPAAARRVHRRRAVAAGRSAATTRSIEAEVTLPDGTKQKVNLVQQGDHVSGVFDQTQTAGDYAIAVTRRTRRRRRWAAPSRDFWCSSKIWNWTTPWPIRRCWPACRR